MMDFCNGNKIYENSDSLLCLLSVDLAASTKKDTNVKNFILAKLSSCKCPVKELQKENKVHSHSRSTSTIHFGQHISPIKPSSGRVVVNFSQKLPRVT